MENKWKIDSKIVDFEFKILLTWNQLIKDSGVIN